MTRWIGSEVKLTERRSSKTIFWPSCLHAITSSAESGGKSTSASKLYCESHEMLAPRSVSPCAISKIKPIEPFEEY